MEIDGKSKLMSVIFVPHTERSELAKRWRLRLEQFEKVGSIKIKVVERAGSKVVDLLHKSNSWEDLDCEREVCLICASCVGTEKRGKCKKRNIVYETYCITCQKKYELEKGLEELENGEGKEKDKDIEETESESKRKWTQKENGKRERVKKETSK